MNDKILYTENMMVGYKKPIIENININAYKGELICIIGRNGAGKSTLLNTLAGIIKPLSGKIFYNGKNLSELSLTEKTTLISYVPSKQEYLSNLKVYDIVAMGRSPYTNIFDKHSKMDEQIIKQGLSEFNLEELQKKYLYEISDGERQRAMICRAIVQETPIILLDEPTAFLDYYAKQKLLDDLSKLSTEKNKCIIFSSHDLELSLNYTNLVWLFSDEKKLNVATTEDLKKSRLLEKLMNFTFNQNKKQ